MPAGPFIVTLNGKRFRVLHTEWSSAVAEGDAYARASVSQQAAVTRLRADNARLADEFSVAHDRAELYRRQAEDATARRAVAENSAARQKAAARRACVALAMNVAVDEMLALICTGLRTPDAGARELKTSASMHHSDIVSLARKVNEVMQISVAGSRGVARLVAVADTLNLLIGERASVKTEAASGGAGTAGEGDEEGSTSGDGEPGVALTSASARASLTRAIDHGIKCVIERHQRTLTPIIVVAEQRVRSATETDLDVIGKDLGARINLAARATDTMGTESVERMTFALRDWVQMRLRHALQRDCVTLDTGVRMRMIHVAIRGPADPQHGASAEERRSWEEANVLMVDKWRVMDPEIRSVIAPTMKAKDFRALLDKFVGDQQEIASGIAHPAKTALGSSVAPPKSVSLPRRRGAGAAATPVIAEASSSSSDLSGEVDYHR